MTTRDRGIDANLRRSQHLRVPEYLHREPVAKRRTGRKERHMPSYKTVNRAAISRLAAFTILALLVACTRKAPNGNNLLETGEPKLSNQMAPNEPFDPRITVDWPAVPKESRAGSDEHKSYTAIVTLRRNPAWANFMLVVTTYSDDDIRKETAKGLIESAAFAGKDAQTSRKAVELPPKRYPGLEITRVMTTPKGKSLAARPHSWRETG
jgi:hypothetical protein